MNTVRASQPNRLARTGTKHHPNPTKEQHPVTASTPIRLVLSTTQDVVEAVPTLLGFHPENSFVMVAVANSRHPFGGRVDLPVTIDEIPDVISAMIGPALRNDAHRVLLYLYDDEQQWPDLLEIAHAAFESAGIGVVDLVHVHHGTADSKNRPLDTVILDQPGKIAAQAAYQGRAASRDRAAHIARVASKVDPRLYFPTEDIAPEDACAYAGRVIDRIAGEELTLEEVVHLAAAVHDPDARDRILGHIMATPKTPGGADWWASVARNTLSCAETQHLFGLIALGLYMNGEGSLCWTVIDRAPLRTNLVDLALQVVGLGINPDRVADQWGDLVETADQPNHPGLKENA